MAIMTELLRLILRSPFPIDVIFNFNGGEETPRGTYRGTHGGIDRFVLKSWCVTCLSMSGLVDHQGIRRISKPILEDSEQVPFGASCESSLHLRQLSCPKKPQKSITTSSKVHHY